MTSKRQAQLARRAAADAAFEAGLDRLPPAPRPVPFTLAWTLRFGHVLTWFGLTFFYFGLVMLAVILDPVGVVRGWRLADNPSVAQGTIEAWREANVEVNGVMVIENDARFPCGAEVCTCTAYADGLGLEAGTPVTVNYLPDAPKVCVIVGMRGVAVPGGFAAFVLIFPLVGLGLVVFPWRRGHRLVRLLRSGAVAGGKVIDRQGTNVRVNGDRVWKVTVRFTDAAGADHEVMVRTTDVEDLTDDRRERLLYLPDQPQVVAMVDTLPDAVVLSAEGAWQPAPLAPVVFSFMPHLAGLFLVLGVLAVSLAS